MKKVFALLMAALLALSALGCSDLPEPGKVMYLNCDPAAAEAWQKLATAYSDIYGVEVTIRTVSTEDCAAAIRAALSWENAPTAFQFHDEADLDRFKGNCLDLTGTAVLGQMISGSLNITDGGAVRALCYSYDAFGLLVNTSLLTAAGFDVADITDFSSLKTLAEDIHSRREELGFDAFAALAEDGSTAGQLTQLTRYYEEDHNSLELFRQVMDLYIDNSSPMAQRSAADQSLAQFAQGQAVFCQHSAAVYGTLVAEPYNMDGSVLTMIPVLFGAEQEGTAPLSTTPRSYWAVNSKASDADRAATLDFLNWVASSEDGIRILQDQYGGVPFKAAAQGENAFYRSANSLLAQGNSPMILTNQDQPERQAAINEAVAAYAALRTDENWQKVEATFYGGEDLT